MFTICALWSHSTINERACTYTYDSCDLGFMFSMSHNLSISLGLNVVFRYPYYGNVWSVLTLKPISVAIIGQSLYI